jgi:dissimilatory sulfite reductase related protein
MIQTDGSKPLTGDLSRVYREITGKKILFDNEGFIWHPEDWTEEIAEILGAENGVEKFTEAQWRIMKFLREFYFYNGRAPMNRDIKAATGMSFMEMEGLFPGGIRRGARRFAGLPNPKSCAGY